MTPRSPLTTSSTAITDETPPPDAPSSSLALWIAAPIGLLLLYILSPAPLMKIIILTDFHSSWLEKVLSVIYAPLEYLSDHYEIIHAFYEWQMHLLGVI